MTQDASPRLAAGWTIEAYVAHNEAMRSAESRFQDERDRRYMEVNIEKEKALKIKETADLAALGLAREIQTYKDEKANELREQIGAERGLYVTRTEMTALADKIDVLVTPLNNYVTSQQGRNQGIGLIIGGVVIFFSFILTAVGLLGALS